MDSNIRRFLIVAAMLLAGCRDAKPQADSSAIGGGSGSAQVFNGFLYANAFGSWSIPQGDAGQFTWSNPAVCVNREGLSFNIFSVNTKILIRDANPAQNETVSVTQVNRNSASCSISTAALTYTHYSFSISSGTAGLQEAINYALQRGLTTTVVMTPAWALGGGTTAMINAATGSTKVTLLDQRAASSIYYTWNGTAYQQISITGDFNAVSVNKCINPTLITGFTDIGQQINNACSAYWTPSIPADVCIPPGTYQVKTTINPTTSCNIHSDGPYLATLNGDPVLGNNQVFKVLGTSATPITSVRIHDLAITNGTPSSTGPTVGKDAIRADYCNHCSFDHLYISSVQGTYGIAVKNSNDVHADWNDIENFAYCAICYLTGSQWVTASNNYIDTAVANGLEYGISLAASEDNNPTTDYTHHGVARDNTIRNILQWEGMDSHGGIDQLFENNWIENVYFGVQAGTVNNGTLSAPTNFNALDDVKIRNNHIIRGTGKFGGYGWVLAGQDVVSNITNAVVDNNEAIGFGYGANQCNITNVQIDASNNAIITCSPMTTAFPNGISLLFSGLTTATFLNGVTLFATGTPTTTSFTANSPTFTHAAYGPATDTGTAAASQYTTICAGTWYNTRDAKIANNKMPSYHQCAYGPYYNNWNTLFTGNTSGDLLTANTPLASAHFILNGPGNWGVKMDGSEIRATAAGTAPAAMLYDSQLASQVSIGPLNRANYLAAGGLKWNGGVFGSGRYASGHSVSMLQFTPYNQGTITQVAVNASNVATVTVGAMTTSFKAGQSVSFSGLTTATFLNGNSYTLTSATTTSLTFALVRASYGPTADTGTATFGMQFNYASGDMGYDQTGRPTYSFSGPAGSSQSAGYYSTDGVSVIATGNISLSTPTSITSLAGSSTFCGTPTNLSWTYCLPPGMNIVIAGAGVAGAALNAQVVANNGLTITIYPAASTAVTGANITYQTGTISTTNASSEYTVASLADCSQGCQNLSDSVGLTSMGFAYSTKQPYLAYNAIQVPTLDLWQQPNAALPSMLLTVGQAGTRLYQANAGAASAAFSTFWGTAINLFDYGDFPTLPFTATANCGNGCQLTSGATSFSGFGFAFSTQNPYLAYNAKQNPGSDSWSQVNSASSSELILLTSNGVQVYTAIAGTATGNLATFWGASKWTCDAGGNCTVNQLKVGSTGTSLVKIAKYAQSNTPAITTASSCTEQNLTFTGVAAGDIPLGINAPATLGGNIWIGGLRISSANTVAVNFCSNATAGTPPAGTYTVVVAQ